MVGTGSTLCTLPSMGLGKGHRGGSWGAWGNEKTESSMLYGFVIWFGVSQGTETTEEHRKEARLL